MPRDLHYFIKFYNNATEPVPALLEKCLNTEVILVPIFPHSGWIPRDTPYLSVFIPNAGPEFTPYFNTFHAVDYSGILFNRWEASRNFTISIDHAKDELTQPSFNDTHREKLCFTQIQYQNDYLAASDFFHMFTQ